MKHIKPPWLKENHLIKQWPHAKLFVLDSQESLSMKYHFLLLEILLRSEQITIMATAFLNNRIQAVELGVSKVTGDTGRTGKQEFCNAFLFCSYSDLGSYNFQI